MQSGFDVVAPSPSSSSGGATVGYSLTSEIVLKSRQSLDDLADTEMIWNHLDLIPDVKAVTLSDPQFHIVKSRMTLDYWEDYVKLEAVRLMIGNLASRSQVSQLLDHNPDLDN